MTRIEFSPKEAEAIRHRLEVPDAMTDVFDPEVGDGNDWGPQERDELFDLIVSIISDIFIDQPGGSMILEFDEDDRAHKAIIKEAIEGSTMLSIALDLKSFHYSEREHRQGRAWIKALESIEDKLSAAGMEARFT